MFWIIYERMIILSAPLSKRKMKMYWFLQCFGVLCAQEFCSKKSWNTVLWICLRVLTVQLYWLFGLDDAADLVLPVIRVYFYSADGFV